MMGKYVHLCVPCGIVRWTPYKPMPLSEECKCVLISVDAAMGLPKYFYIHKNAMGKVASKGFT